MKNPPDEGFPAAENPPCSFTAALLGSVGMRGGIQGARALLEQPQQCFLPGDAQILSETQFSEGEELEG